MSKKEAEQAAAISAAKIRVLVVESNLPERLHIEEALTAEKNPGFQAIPASTLAEALDLLKNQWPDVIILDLNLSDSRGHETFVRIQNAARELPIVVLSTDENDLEAMRAMSEGAQDHLTSGSWDGRLMCRVVRHAIQRRISERAIYQSAERFRSLVTNIPGAVYRARRNGGVDWSTEYFSDAIQAVTGYPASDFVHDRVRSFQSLVVAEDLYAIEGALNSLISENPSFSVDYRIKHADGKVRWVHEQGRVVFSPSGEKLWRDGIIFDVTDRMQTEARMNYLTYHDSLTGLPNRMFFMERLGASIGKINNGYGCAAIFFLGLDHFKRINDTVGHAVGDRLLKAVALRIGNVLDEADVMTRIGGDEFAILKPQMANAEDAVEFTKKIFQKFRFPFQISGNEIFMNCSIGISFYPGDGKTADELLKKADAAMSSVKTQGRNNYQFYSAAQDKRGASRLELETGLRHAIERKEFHLYYQPQLDMRTGEITGAEALIRWKHPKLGLVSPADFIPLAEETGFIVTLGEWVLRTACAQNKAWQDAGFPLLRVAVNLSARQFQQADLTKLVARILGQTGMDSKMLELELTETIVMQNVTRTIETLRALHAMGLHISIDDFGTGYSSLSYLKRFPISTLKVDRTFVKDIAGDSDASAIVKAIISMAHNLKLEVIAEGVETDTQLTFLRSQGCDKMQGFLFSPAVPAEEFTHMLLDGRRLPLEKWKKEAGNGNGSDVANEAGKSH